MSGRVDGKVIVVTGAGSGQGAAEASLLGAEGATVIACDIGFSADGPSAGAASGSGGVGGSVTQQLLNVAEPEAWLELKARVEDEFAGRVDGLINNAGVTSRVRLPDVSLEEWNRVLAINLTGPMLGIQTLIPLFSEGASIVNVSSLAGVTGHYTAAYTASKWGLRGLTHTAVTELGPRGIRVNTVLPGYIETPMTASAPSTFLQANKDLTPLARGGTPEEVADLMVFLMSDESRFISGAEIIIDGGQARSGGAKYLSEAVSRGGI